MEGVQKASTGAKVSSQIVSQTAWCDHITLILHELIGYQFVSELNLRC